MHPCQEVRLEIVLLFQPRVNTCARLLPQTVQTVLFSATFPEKVVKYAANFAPNSNQITLRHEELTVKGIKQVCLDCRDEEHKFEVLVNLYGLMTIGSSIIFVNV